MAIKYQKKRKDKIARKNFVTLEKKKRYYKFMTLKYQRMINSNVGILKRKSIQLIMNFKNKIQEMPKHKINNYCILTGRDKGVYRDFKLSRHQIKENFKFLTGLRNSSF